MDTNISLMAGNATSSARYSASRNAVCRERREVGIVQRIAHQVREGHALHEVTRTPRIGLGNSGDVTWGHLPGGVGKVTDHPFVEGRDARWDDGAQHTFSRGARVDVRLETGREGQPARHGLPGPPVEQFASGVERSLGIGVP